MSALRVCYRVLNEVGRARGLWPGERYTGTASGRVTGPGNNYPEPVSVSLRCEALAVVPGGRLRPGRLLDLRGLH